MKNLLILLLLMTISYAKVSMTNSDYTNSKLILGYWSMTMVEENFTFYGEYLYKKNGTKEGIFEICIKSKCYKIYFESNWEIKNGFLFSSVKKSSSKYLPAGTVIKDQILKLDKKVMILLSEDGKEQNTRLYKPKFFK